MTTWDRKGVLWSAAHHFPVPRSPSLLLLVHSLEPCSSSWTTQLEYRRVFHRQSEKDLVCLLDEGRAALPVFPSDGVSCLVQGPWFATGCPCSGGCYVCRRGSFTTKFRHVQHTDWCSWEALGVLGRLQHHRGMQLSEVNEVFRLMLRRSMRNFGAVEVEVGCDHFLNGRSVM